jgi:hypothetical protein
MSQRAAFEGQPVMQAERPSFWRRLLRSEWLVPVPILVLYGLFLYAFYGPGHDARDAAWIGTHLVQQSHASSTIKFDPSYAYPGGEWGYDGQYVYFIALDPINAHYYTDSPSYRYTRIVYPLLARLLAAGQPALIPYALLLINWLAIGGGTLAAAAWLRRKGVSPWLALAYGFYPGLFIALVRDTTEALAYALVALGVFLWDYGGRRRIALAACAFSVAVLTRETTALFPVMYGLGLMFARPIEDGETSGLRARLTPAIAVIALSVVPLLVYKAFLVAWLGTHADPGLLLERFPFLGLYRAPWSPGWVEGLRTVVIPALIAGGAALLMVWRRPRIVAPWLLLLNVLVFVVFLHRTSYEDISASGRVTTGVALAAVLCVPVAARLLGTRSWFWASTTLWLSVIPIWVGIPEFQYLGEVIRRLRLGL